MIERHKPRFKLQAQTTRDFLELIKARRYPAVKIIRFLENGDTEKMLVFFKLPKNVNRLRERY